MHRIIGAALLINLAFTLFLYSWVSDEDISGLPSAPRDRLVALFYLSVALFTGTGGDMVPKTTRARVALTAYMGGALSTIVAKIINKI